MATFYHPITGVELNSIEVKRPNLTKDEAITAHVLRMNGHKIQTITAMLGTNQGRVMSALNGETYPNAASDAAKLTA
jgi:hypothetical protein